ncbi:hypothetical protein [Helicobacter bizzozeronii]|uniref:hypothetical protein n=1 Tax=Helicobacter bizzozeronii TaxID=56877 RepID=UPI000CF1639F|nr:hypothetical protein [Helicobacter bizzozeronii]
MSEQLLLLPKPSKPALSVVVCKGRNKDYPDLEKDIEVRCYQKFVPPKIHPLGFRSDLGENLFERLYDQAQNTKPKKRSGFFSRENNALLKMIFNVYEDTGIRQVEALIDEIVKRTNFTFLECHKITPTAYEALFFTLDRQSGKQLARYSESLSKENLMRFQTLIYEILDPKTEVPDQGMFVSSKEYLGLVQTKKDYEVLQAKLQEIQTDTTEFANAMEELLFKICATNFEITLHDGYNFYEKVNPFMKKYFGTLIGLKDFGGKKAVTYQDVSDQDLEQIKKDRVGFGLEKL